jgi:hypothetical protein
MARIENDVGWIACDVDGVNPLWSLAITASVVDERDLEGIALVDLVKAGQ